MSTHICRYLYSQDRSLVLREGEAVFGNAMTLQDEGSFTEYYRSMILIPLEDYNRLLGAEETLAPGEALIYTPRTTILTAASFLEMSRIR